MKQLQKALGIGAYQSIYDWFSGKSLPSLDNMLALSRLLDIPIEGLVICKNDSMLVASEKDLRKRLENYRQSLSGRVA